MRIPNDSLLLHPIEPFRFLEAWRLIFQSLHPKLDPSCHPYCRREYPEGSVPLKTRDKAKIDGINIFIAYILS